MNASILRGLSLAMLWSLASTVGLSQSDAPAQAPRTLDDVRREVQATASDNQPEGMSEGGMMGSEGGADGGFGSGMPGGMGMPGMGMGGEPGAGMAGPGMGGPGMGGPGMGSGMGSWSVEKRLLAQLIQQLRARLSAPDVERETVERQLQAALQEYFELDMQERVRELDKVKARLTEMENKLQRRLDSVSEIVDLQLKQILHEADGLDFSIPNGSSAGGMGAGGMGGGGMGAGGMGGPGMGMGSMGGMMGGEMDSSGPDIGYDATFAMTRVKRLDVKNLTDTDPLKAYSGNFDSQAVQQTQARTDEEKLEKVLLAFHTFYSQFNHYPRSANRQTKSQPPHSWRVAILPALGYGELYKQYDFDQPWDSEHNSKLVSQMPDVFRSADQASGDKTRLVMLVGGGAFDSLRTPPSLRQITDGSSNTIALIASADEVVWTKPEDVTYSATGPLPKLSAERLVGLADGSVQHLPELNDNQLRALITRAGGEVVRLK